MSGISDPTATSAAMAPAMHSMVKARLLFDSFMVHSSFRGLTAPWS